MKYLCLVYADEARVTGMPQNEIDALIDETVANNEELQASGQLILAQALEHVTEATTVRVRNGKLSATDGPSPKPTSSSGDSCLSRQET